MNNNKLVNVNGFFSWHKGKKFFTNKKLFSVIFIKQDIQYLTFRCV